MKWWTKCQFYCWKFAYYFIKCVPSHTPSIAFTVTLHISHIHIYNSRQSKKYVCSHTRKPFYCCCWCRYSLALLILDFNMINITMNGKQTHNKCIREVERAQHIQMRKKVSLNLIVSLLWKHGMTFIIIIWLKTPLSETLQRCASLLAGGHITPIFSSRLHSTYEWNAANKVLMTN